jgi:hypothetical protein
MCVLINRKVIRTLVIADQASQPQIPSLGLEIALFHAYHL